MALTGVQRTCRLQMSGGQSEWRHSGRWPALGPSDFCLILGDRKIGTRAPFRPGTVVDTSRFCAERFEAESEDRGGDTGATAGDHWLVGVDAGFLESLRNAFGRGEATIFHDLGERHAERTRHMSGAKSGPRLGLASGETSGRTR